MEQRSQPPRGPVQPDDVRNYGAGALMGQVINALKTGWNHAVTLKSTLGVTGATTLGGAFTQGSNAFPAHAAGQVHFRTDKKTWYYDDGVNWNIVGVEQTIETGAAPVQTINSTTFADITSSSITVTTTGAGAIVVWGMVRCNTISGTLVIQSFINGTSMPVDVTQGNTVDASIAVAHRVAVAAAGSYTVKLQAKMAAAATSATVTSFNYVTMATAA